MRRLVLATSAIHFLLVVVLAGCESSDQKNETPNRPSNDQAVAIAEIERQGGKVKFDEKAPGKPIYSVSFAETGIGVTLQPSEVVLG